METHDLLDDTNAPMQDLNNDERTWGTIAHLGNIAGLMVPFGNILTPLLIWMFKREESEFIEEQAKEALNFQLSISVLALCCIPLVFVVVGIFFLIGLAALDFVASILAAINANEGKQFRYPLNFRWIK